MLNKTIEVKCLKIGYILEDSYYKDLLDIFKEHLTIIDDTDFKGRKLKITLHIRETK